jgi:hypothetical protein
MLLTTIVLNLQRRLNYIHECETQNRRSPYTSHLNPSPLSALLLLESSSDQNKTLPTISIDEIYLHPGSLITWRVKPGGSRFGSKTKLLKLKGGTLYFQNPARPPLLVGKLSSGTHVPTVYWYVVNGNTNEI